MVSDVKTLIVNCATAAYEHAEGLVNGVVMGDVGSISIAALIFLIILAILWKDSRKKFFFTKSVFILLILSTSLYFIATKFAVDIIQAQGIDELTLIIGIVGFCIGLFIIIQTMRALFKAGRRTDAEWRVATVPRARAVIIEEGSGEEPGDLVELSPPPAAKAVVIKATAAKKKSKAAAVAPERATFLPKSMNAEQSRSLLMVIGTVMVVEFGIFSSPTVAAPNAMVGMVFFGAFLFGVFIFLKATYAHQYLRGLFHALVALVFGFGLSVLLGHYWGGLAWTALLSINYFATTSMIALMSGIALSLLVGGK